MPDAPAQSLVETVAAKYAEFLECTAARDLKAPLCMDDGMCSCRRDAAFIASAVLDAIAEPSEDFTFRCFATGNPSIEAMRETLVVKRDYEWWALRFREDIRAMIAELRKGIDNA